MDALISPRGSDQALAMKNVTFMIAAAGLTFLALPAQASAPLASRGDSPLTLVSDLPLASPDNRFAALSPLFASGVSRTAGPRSFYAPGASPRCEIRMRRVQGRVFQSCE
ncbi:MAG: hypothetical protein AB7U62_00340 [Pseudolabrys sp.]